MRTSLVLAALLLSPLAVDAATAAPPLAQEASAMTNGEVRKVDKGQGKITIRHGPLTNLGMPAMTMVFRVKDPAMLERVKEGDNIRFVADRVDESLTVVKLEPAR